MATYPLLVLASTGAPATGTAASPADLLAARQQMALSLGWHIIMSCLGIGFASLVVFTEWLARRRRDPIMLTLARRWSHALGVLFPIGAVSGTILSFEFGILWPGLMGNFGDVFGIPFAMEGFAFFIEAIFIGIYVYGWSRLSPKVHLLCGIPIIVSGILAAAFIIMANAWMNHPGGFTTNADGTYTVTDPWAAVNNSGVWVQYAHMLLAAFIVAGFLTAMVYARPILKGSKLRYHRIAFALPFAMGAIALPIQMFVGDQSVRWVAANQPVKEAAAEAHFPSETNAPEIIFGIPHQDGTVTGGITIPNGLSILTGFNPDTYVPGLDAVPSSDWPPLVVTHWAFDLMVTAGTFLMLPVLWFAWKFWRKRRLPRSKLFWWLGIAAGPLAVLCLEAGWVTTEVGRQPWIVYDVLRTTDAVTAASGIRYGYYLIVVVYLALTVATIWGLKRLARIPLPVHARIEVDDDDERGFGFGPRPRSRRDGSPTAGTHGGTDATGSTADAGAGEHGEHDAAGSPA